MKLYFLHGFAGDPRDWDEVISYLPSYNCTALSYPFQLPTDGVLIGYSMGGRIALHSPGHKIVIGGNPLPKKQTHWAEKLRTSSLAQFFEEWYSQPLFASLKAHPHYPTILERRLQQNRETLLQQLQTPTGTSLQNTIFMHGALDTTYHDLYRALEIPSHEIPNAGHACHLENPLGTSLELKKIIDNMRVK